jgi:hypothetical protein
MIVCFILTESLCVSHPSDKKILHNCIPSSQQYETKTSCVFLCKKSIYATFAFNFLPMSDWAGSQLNVQQTRQMSTDRKNHLSSHNIRFAHLTQTR